MAGTFDNSSSLCQPCPQYCTDCTSSILCTSCADSFVILSGLCGCDGSNQMLLYKDVCKPCYTFVSYCLSCDGTSGAILCLTCVEGTYLSSDNKTCALCDVGCFFCNDTTCIICQAGYTLSLGSCSVMTSCQGVSGADSACLECLTVNTTVPSIDPVTNLTVNTTSSQLQCMACLPGFYDYDNTSCLACPSTCSTCLLYNECQLCITGYTLINGNCTCNSYNNEL